MVREKRSRPECDGQKGPQERPQADLANTPLYLRKRSGADTISDRWLSCDPAWSTPDSRPRLVMRDVRRRGQSLVVQQRD
jgi:hypothetical protein